MEKYIKSLDGEIDINLTELHAKRVPKILLKLKITYGDLICLIFLISLLCITVYDLYNIENINKFWIYIPIYIGVFIIIAILEAFSLPHEKLHKTKCDKLYIKSEIIRNNKCIINDDKFHNKQDIIKALLYPLWIQIIFCSFMAMIVITLDQNIIFKILYFINMILLAIPHSSKDIIDYKMLSKFSDYKYCKMDISEYDTETDKGNIYYILKKELD